MNQQSGEFFGRFGRWAVRKHHEPVFSTRFFIVSILLILVSQALSGLWIFNYPNLLSTEALRMFAGRPVAKFTDLVVIDQKEYPDSTWNHSPLTPERLRNAICTVLAHRPKVLVVDFDTSDSAYQVLQFPHPSTSVVWGRTANRFRGETFVGNYHGKAVDAGDYGFAVGVEDRDGTVRNFLRTIKIDGKVFTTLYWRAVQLFRGQNSQNQTAENLEILTLSTNFQFPSYRLRELPKGRPDCTVDLAAIPSPDFSDRVVLLGGNYDLADTHHTSYGDSWGIEVLGGAIEAELSGQGVRHFPLLQKVLLKCILALCLGIVYSRLYAFPATLFTFIVLIPIVLFGNVIALWVAGYDGMIVPLLMGLSIELLANAVEKADESQRRLDK